MHVLMGKLGEYNKKQKAMFLERKAEGLVASLSN